ncbi:MAG: PDZ domain-containing protein [Flavobacteriales bacterium]
MKTIYTLLFACLASFSLFSQGNGYLGISMKKASEEGVRISDVLENGAAFVYGLQQNDIILSVDGKEVNSSQELKNKIVANDWGETISLLYKRNGHTRIMDVVLGNRANKVTYQIKRRKINATYEWNFDENTWISVLNGNATKIVKLNENGVKAIHNIAEGTDLPQSFSDLDDKMEIIAAIEERNAGKRFYPSITVYIKTYTEPSKIKTVPNANLSAELKAFPNPSLGEFQFTLKMEEATSTNLSWQVIDVTGKKITEGNLAEFNGATNQKLDLTNHGAGVYLLRVVNGKELMTERLVVK